jgi:hypothetical protein
MKDDDKCNVCEGLGLYPIHDRRGKEVFCIECPACDGCGLSDDAITAEGQLAFTWHDAATDEKRAR